MEVWDSTKSSILQVLVSVQGLVLVPEPYYNEAGYEKQIGTQEGRHNSRQYNESTLLLTLKHMIVTLNNPLPPFEEMAKRHFRQCRKGILERCLRMTSDADQQLASGVAGGSSAPGAAGGSNVEAGWVDRSVPERASVSQWCWHTLDPPHSVRLHL